jgi:Leucine-rich repeat (LRR) protein
MTIKIKFHDDTTKYTHNSFDELLNLDNYDEIINLDCSKNNLSTLPKLPDSLTELDCSFNNLSILPELPKFLKKIDCSYNNLSILPKLSNSLIEIDSSYNNLYTLPKLSNNLIELFCNNNNLLFLPYLPDSLEHLICYSNPIKNLINKKFNGLWKEYREYKNLKMKKQSINKISNWYLECKYNPKYLYCRNRLEREFHQLNEEYIDRFT